MLVQVAECKSASHIAKRRNLSPVELLPYVGLNQQVQRVRFCLLNSEESPRTYGIVVYFPEDFKEKLYGSAAVWIAAQQLCLFSHPSFDLL